MKREESIRLGFGTLKALYGRLIYDYLYVCICSSRDIRKRSPIAIGSINMFALMRKKNGEKGEIWKNAMNGDGKGRRKGSDDETNH